MPTRRPSAYDSPYPDSEERFSELQDVLVGEYIQEQQHQGERIERLEAIDPYNSLAVARSLAEAARGEPKIRKALFPVIEDALRISVEENPSMMAGILFPIIGEAVRKAVAAATQEMMDQTNELLANSLSAERIGWRIEAWRNGKSFAEVAFAHSHSYRVEQVYAIHRTTGLLLGEVTNRANLLQDPDMVVGMLTAIQDFVRDSFTSNQTADLNVIQVGEFKIWLQHGPVVLLAAVISGQPKARLRTVLVERVEEIHRSFPTSVANFEATGQSIPGLDDELKECLVEEKQQGKETKEASYLKFKIAGWILVALVLAASYVYGRRAVLWNNYIERLERQPGLVVIDSARGWTTLTVRGLRDPLAIDPASLLEHYDLSPDNVHEVWEPYYSLDGPFVGARRVVSEADALRNITLRFDVGSTALTAGQMAQLDLVSETIQHLAADARQANRSLHIRILGHTDNTGTSEYNDMLSQTRAQSVLRLLVGRGIDPGLLTASGLRDAPSVFGPPATADEDRRVTFAVDLR